MNPLFPAVALCAGHRCEYCHAPQSVFNFQFEVEHIAPRSIAGTNDENNLALACHACNRFKSDRVSATDSETGQETRLFHPRQDRWEDHFKINADNALVVGITPIGRVTVEQLKMNVKLQVEARRLWLRLELFS